MYHSPHYTFSARWHGKRAHISIISFAAYLYPSWIDHSDYSLLFMAIGDKFQMILYLIGNKIVISI